MRTEVTPDYTSKTVFYGAIECLPAFLFFPDFILDFFPDFFPRLFSRLFTRLFVDFILGFFADFFSHFFLGFEVTLIAVVLPQFGNMSVIHTLVENIVQQCLNHCNALYLRLLFIVE